MKSVGAKVVKTGRPTYDLPRAYQSPLSSLNNKRVTGNEPKGSLGETDSITSHLGTMMDWCFWTELKMPTDIKYL